MKQILIVLTCFLISWNYSFAQTKEILDEKMKQNKPDTEYSWFYKNIFFEYKVSACSEFLIIPAIEYKFLETWNYFPPTDEDDYDYYTDKGFMASIGTFTLEPRINVINFSKNAISLRFPLAFGLSLTFEGAKYDNFKSMGVFHYAVPALLSFAHGLNSTYSNVDNYGFAVSGGIQFLRTSVLGEKLHKHYEEYYVSQTPFNIRKKWVMPLVQIDFYHITKNDKLRGYSLSFSPIKSFYFKLAMTFVPSKK